MSVLIFKLRHVPDDEASDVRALLDEHRIEYFETTAGNWGIAMPGLWTQDADAEEARWLIDEYQQQRSIEQRNRHIEAIQAGHKLTVFTRIKQRPFAILGILLFCAFLLYALLAPFIRLALPAS